MHAPQSWSESAGHFNHRDTFLSLDEPERDPGAHNNDGEGDIDLANEQAFR